MWQGPLTIHLFICLVLQRSKGQEPRLVHRGISGTLFPRPSQTPICWLCCLWTPGAMAEECH